MREICKNFRKELVETVIVKPGLHRISKKVRLSPKAKTQTASILRTLGKREPEVRYNESDYFSNQGKYQQLYDTLYKKYVPPSGPAKTKQGNLLRTISTLTYHHMNDGDVPDDEESEYLFTEGPRYSSLPEAVNIIFYDHQEGNLGNLDEEYNRAMNASVRHIIEQMYKGKKSHSRRSSSKKRRHS